MCRDDSAEPARLLPVGGWYGLKKGCGGRFGMHLPPLIEALGLAELEHSSRNNRMRAISKFPRDLCWSTDESVRRPRRS